MQPSKLSNDVELYEARTIDVLCMLIESVPVNQDASILFIHKTGRTIYRFPAVIGPDGYSINSDGKVQFIGKRNLYEWFPSFATPEQHLKYHVARRARIARDIRANRRSFK